MGVCFSSNFQLLEFPRGFSLPFLLATGIVYGQLLDCLEVFRSRFSLPMLNRRANDCGHDVTQNLSRLFK